MRLVRLAVVSLAVSAVCAVSACSGGGDVQEGASSEVTSTSAAPKLPAIGEEATNAGAKLVVNSVEEADSLSLYAEGYKRGYRPDEVVYPRQGGKFVIVSTTVENTGTETWDLTCGAAIMAKLVSREDNQYDPIQSLYRVHDNPECNDMLGAGFPTKMTWVFEIPTSKQARAFGFREYGNYNGEYTLVDFDLPHKTSEQPTTSSTTPVPSTESAAAPAPANDGGQAGAPAAAPVVDAPVQEMPAPAAPAQPAQPQEEVVIGFTGAPGHDAPAPMNKTIASCGDVSMHEIGTTFFTDGTSGWTQQCSNSMLAQVPANKR